MNTSFLTAVYHASTSTPVYQLARRISSALLHWFHRYDWGIIFKKGHVTLTTPIFGVVCHPKLGFDTAYVYAKFDDSSFSHSRYIFGSKV